MTVSEIREKLDQERKFGSRFPARIIFTESLDSYLLLENQLRGICDVTLNAADFCRAPDTVPQFDKIQKELEGCEGRQILLLSVGEYLRLCVKRELNADRRQLLPFLESQQAESSRTRIIIPMFSCRDIFDRVAGPVYERQQDYVWTLDAKPSAESYTICVYSPRFREAVHPDADNLTEWLRNWQTILKKGAPCSVVTLQINNVETSCGTVSIKPIDSPFLELRDSLADGDALVENWENDDFWSRMAACAGRFQDRPSFEKIALSALNVKEFDFVAVAARWQTLDAFQKELVWLWYRIRPAGDYYSHACRKAARAAEIPDKIRDEILLVSDRSAAWIAQRMAAMEALSFSSFHDAYFALMDQLPLAETKLRLLTYRTHEERTYAVKVISGLLRSGAEPDAVADMIAGAYPALAAYMREDTGRDKAVDEYMRWYRKNKLINRYPGEYPVPMTFDRFDSRLKLTQQVRGKDCVSFWIDGFGVEYAPLFVHELKARGIVSASVNIATALLPSETEYNHQWDEHESTTVKWDRLDALSHRGMPDDKSYYSCIVRQLAVFAEAAEEVGKLLAKHDYVLITGDHGSSRLAALAFHDAGVVPVTAPRQSTVHSFGRFCQLSEASVNMAALPGTSRVSAAASGETFLVMNNYRHFSVGGNAAGGNTDQRDVVGEVHGGNTAEERLVCVIVVKRSQPLAPLTCTPKSRYVTRRNGHVETVFSFNRPVSSLAVSHGENKAVCTKAADGAWRIALDHVTTDEFVLSVIADGKLLPGVDLKVRRQGIDTGSDPFGGMGL